MNKLPSLLAAMFVAATSAGCSESVPGAATKVLNANSQYCRLNKAFTGLKVGAYTIKIFEPNAPTNPDIRQGPVCVASESNNVECGFDLSLIKRIAPSADMKQIEVAVFSGSNSRIVQISLATCQVTDVN